MIVPCASCAKANRVPAARLADNAKCAACKAPLLPMDHPVAVGSAADFDELVKSSPVPVLVDFWASWCGPCRQLGPELEQLARDRGGKVVIAKVDTDALPAVAGRFGIQAIPTMILFKGGAEAKRESGAMRKEQVAAKFAI